jgi:Protein of unknown function (DUF2817)
MMGSEPESIYRGARRAFIAACEAAHVDAIARPNPAKSPDGKPLFMDCAALGPRHAPRAMLVVAEGAAGAGLLIGLLSLSPPSDARLVLVHALDPAAFAGVQGDPGWPPAMLAAVAAEDLSRVRDLAIMALDGDGEHLKSVLGMRMPGAKIRLLPAPAEIGPLRQAITGFFAE